MYPRLLVSIVVIPYVLFFIVSYFGFYTSPFSTTTPISLPTIKNKSLIFAMIIRDRSEALPYVSYNIEQMAQRAKKATVLVIENDSNENKVVDWLKEWQKKVTQNTNLNILDVDVRSFKWNTPYKEIATLAKARNEALKVVREEEKYKGYDFLVAIDSDLCFRLDMDFMEDILDTLLLTQGQEWDAVFANGAYNWADGWPDHFDRFAYRDDLIVWNPPDGIFYTAALQKKLNPETQFWWDNTFMNPWNCTPVPNRYTKWDCHMVDGQPLINVHSAFGALGFYSSYLIYDDNVSEPCVYTSPNEDCEHVTFNVCLRERFHAKLVVAPRMVIPWLGCDGEIRYHDETRQRIHGPAKEHPLRKSP